MVTDERSRHDLFTRLEEVLGKDSAAVLMEHLPPLGWGEVATKRDLDELRVATRRDLEHLRVAIMGDVQERLNGQLKTFVSIVLGANAVMTGLVIAAIRLG